VLVDDGSLDDVEEVKDFLRLVTKAFGVRVKFHRQHVSVGYASIVTQAARLAEGDYLLLLNNDLKIQRNALRALLGTFDDHDRVGLVVPKFVQENGRVLDAGGIIFSDAAGWQ